MDANKRTWPPKKHGHGKKLEVPPGSTPVIESAGAIVTRAHGPQAQVVQTNSISTPVFVVLVLALFIAALVSAVAIMKAQVAIGAAQLAEREARVLQDKLQHYELLLVEQGLIEAGEVH